MPRLTLYTVFHCNLSFSALPAEDVPLVVARCYHPLLDLCEHHGLPLGIELSGSTFEAARAADPTFVARLERLSRQGRLELVGSGLAQVIQPLVPAAVNRANLAAGIRVYTGSIGRNPALAYLNEQVWSDGMARLYHDAGYEAVVADWWNAASGTGLPPEARYRPTLVEGAGGVVLTVLWNDTEVFQKVQRYAHGRVRRAALLDVLASHVGEAPRALSLYGGDAEIFDYRPGRDLFHHPAERPGGAEMARLAELVAALRADERFELALPSDVLRRFPPKGPPARIADAAYPVRTKKQPKYNVTRWAVTGRADTVINTRCFRAAAALDRLAAVAQAAELPPPARLGVWREQLCTLWSSDYRTHISDRRFERFSDHMGELSGALRRARVAQEEILAQRDGWRLVVTAPVPASGAVVAVTCRFAPAERAEPCGASLDGAPVACQWEDVERFASGDIREARLQLRLSGPRAPGLATLRLDGPPLPRLPALGTRPAWALDGPAVRLQMWDEKPSTVERLTFPGVCPEPLLGTLTHGTFPEVDLLADLFTGHVLIVEEDGRQVTDLDDAAAYEPAAWADEALRRTVEFRTTTAAGELRKRYHVSCVEPVVELEHAFNLRDIQPVAFRLGVATFFAGAFDRDSLAYRTVNGGVDPETFPLAGRTVRQADPVSVRVSARHCLGATEGWVDVLDAEKGVRVSRELGWLYSAPLVHYEEVGEDGALAHLRLLHTIAERDETRTASWRGRHYCRFRWEGFRRGAPPAGPLPVVAVPPVSKL